MGILYGNWWLLYHIWLGGVGTLRPARANEQPRQPRYKVINANERTYSVMLLKRAMATEAK